MDSVELNANYSVEKQYVIKWNVSGKGKQKIKFIPNEVHYGSTPSVINSLQAQVFYADGSYRLSYVKNPYVQGGANAGWTVTWTDHWGIYTHTIQQRKKPKLAVDYGDVSDDVSFYLSSFYTYAEDREWYTLHIFGKGDNGYGTMDNLEEYGWSKYADMVREIYIEDGVTNVPDNAFKNFVNLRGVHLPDSITTIGSNVFNGCKVIKLYMDVGQLSEIGPNAFAGCSIVGSSMFGNYNSDTWTVSLSPYDVGKNITIDYPYGFIDSLTDTYCNYYWSKQK